MRPAGAGLLLAGAVAAVLLRDAAWVGALAAAGVAAHFLVLGGIRRGAAALVPVILFAAVLAGMQWIAGTAGPLLPLKTVAVFALVVPAVRLAPWERAFETAGPGSPLFGVVLFLWMVRHFVRILGQEAWRLLVAQRMAAPRRWRKGWFDSLRWAVAGLFRRALVRAERFYAAQLTRGLGE